MSKDDTREATQVRAPTSTAVEWVEADPPDELLPWSVLDVARSAEELAADVIAALADGLGFERGFVLRETHDAADGGSLFEVVAAQARSADGWSRTRSPEFAVDRSVFLRAVATDETVVVESTLAPGAEDAGSHRTVLARGFPFAPDARGVIYLDRGIGLEALAPARLEAFRTAVDAAGVGIGRAWLAAECARLKERLGEEVAVEPDAPLAEGTSRFGIVGSDEKIQKIFRVIDKVKDSGLNVCIFGESGTGKELVARAIHDASNRRDARFISENCGAISETLLESELFGHVKGSFTGADEDKQGLFELAHGGTLFLDEIGDMSEGMQRKLLRVLQEGTIRPIGAKKTISVDVRVICASNRDLKILVGEGSFRADLFYRLNVIQIEVPPLRDRRGDVETLIEHFVSECAREEGTRKRFSESALRALHQYSWPGNVRELRNVIRRVFLTSARRVVARRDVLPLLTTADAAACLGENVVRDKDELVLRIPLRQNFGEIIEECERLVLLNALRENGWNKSRVTQTLGIPRQSLYNKIAKFDIQKP